MNVTPDAVVPLLLEACPSLLPAWEEHLAWWQPEIPGLFNDVSVFAHHVVDSYAAGRTSEFPAFFGAVEHLLSHGDHATRELIVIGLLEDLQNVASHRSFGYGVFLSWLGPASRAHWGALEAAWQGKTSLMDVLRAEARARK